MSTKAEKAAQEKLDADLRKFKEEEAARKKALEKETTPSCTHNPSWRDHYEPHPAALVFHRDTTNEDRKKMRNDLKESQRLQARIVTAHVADESGGKTYVVDGITRLDEMEKLGWQIVDEHSNWIGQLEEMVDHRRNYTHEQVRQLVISLNANRRHSTKQQIADAIVETLKLERKTVAGVSPHQKRETSPQGGRPPDEFKREAVERGAEAGVSESTIERALAKQSDRPKITKPEKPSKPKGKLPDADDAEDAEDADEIHYADALKKLVLKRWNRLLSKFPPEKKKFVKRELVIELLTLGDSKGNPCKPISVTYNDPKNTTHTIDDVLAGRARIGERRKLKPVRSTTWLKT